jgi:Ni,Fe-hydrogenase III small subunit
MNDQPDHHDHHDDIDALARRAGAEVRRPAPAGFTAGIHRARRRQQTVRAGLGVAGVAALMVVGAALIARRGGDDLITPATVPDTIVADPTTPEVDASIDASTDGAPDPVPAESAGGTESTLPTAATDGIPEAIYTYADDTGTNQDIFDPVTLELIDTIPFTDAITERPTPDAVSASGAIAYGMSTDAQITFDDCNQSPVDIWIDGADPSGLPAQINDLAVSADGRVGVVAATDCPIGRPLAADFAPEGSYPITVAVFDPDHPDAPTRQLIELDGGTEIAHANSLSLSDDGSFLILSTSDRSQAGQEGMFGFTKIIDVATGDAVVDIDLKADTSNLPRDDCGYGYVDLQFVSSTAISYVVICPDQGLVVVVHDLVTNETAESVNPEYTGRTYETMPSARVIVDRSTYANPGTAWFLLCAERETLQNDGTVVFGSPTSHPCWIGHGSEAMREIPTNSAVAGASFEPLP